MQIVIIHITGEPTSFHKLYIKIYISGYTYAGLAMDTRHISVNALAFPPTPSGNIRRTNVTIIITVIIRVSFYQEMNANRTYDET